MPARNIVYCWDKATDAVSGYNNKTSHTIRNAFYSCLQTIQQMPSDQQQTEYQI